MTFQDYFTECKYLITKEIDLPFDCLFSEEWVDKYTPEFSKYHNDNLNPYEAVKAHFADIERAYLNSKRNKTLIKTK
jgi:hypothetical protein